MERLTEQDLKQYRSIVAEMSELNEPCTHYELLKEKKSQIDDFIDEIKDLNIKRIFKERYINGSRKPSFQSIAFKMGYSDEGTPRKIINKYLKQSGV